MKDTSAPKERLDRIASQAFEQLDYSPKTGEALHSYSITPTRLNNVSVQAKRYTGLFSALTGALGLPGQLVDLPGFYLNAVHQLVKIAAIHGYDIRDRKEQRFLLKILAIAHMPLEEDRKKALAEIHLPLRERFMAEEIGGVVMARGATLSVYKMAARVFKNKLRFAVPLVGAASNAASNLALINTILSTAIRGYRRRLELEKSVA